MVFDHHNNVILLRDSARITSLDEGSKQMRHRWGSVSLSAICHRHVTYVTYQSTREYIPKDALRVAWTKSYTQFNRVMCRVGCVLHIPRHFRQFAVTKNSSGHKC